MGNDNEKDVMFYIYVVSVFLHGFINCIWQLQKNAPVEEKNLSKTHRKQIEKSSTDTQVSWLQILCSFYNDIQHCHRKL